ncbi:transposase [Paraburkholderia sp. CNPSo 3272]|uniref:IS66-like element accessory protein TnpA n=1 Tax=Paraburkholderia sp. CNPSo 3272 TaxID=2940931 RepID=UPI0020B7901B|nr:transposase [Paraburkholderia sp. CNPSo 3272]MCP3728752.1 transposase [Paraburkholderia sp. CNPSo 3272]
MNTLVEEGMPSERRRRRRYSEEFKAKVVAACHGTGVSVAAVALEHRLNANLLRRWIDQAEGKAPKGLAGRPADPQPVPAPAFVPVVLETRNTHSAEIRIEVRRGDQAVTVSWPISEAAQCAAWLREWLR